MTGKTAPLTLEELDELKRQAEAWKLHLGDRFYGPLCALIASARDSAQQSAPADLVEHVAIAIRRGRFERTGRGAVFDPDEIIENDRDDARAAIQAMPASPPHAAQQSAPEGWKLMPRDPTEAMQVAAMGPIRDGGRNGPVTSDRVRAMAMCSNYQAMWDSVSSAPTPHTAPPARQAQDSVEIALRQLIMQVRARIDRYGITDGGLIATCDYADAVLATRRTPLPARQAQDELRPEVLAFAQLMEAQLRANDHKPGWKRDYSGDLLDRLREETTELSEALTNYEYRDGDDSDASHVAVISKEAADVANFALMIADVFGALCTPPSAATDQPGHTAPQERELREAAENLNAAIDKFWNDDSKEARTSRMAMPSIHMQRISLAQQDFASLRSPAPQEQAQEGDGCPTYEQLAAYSAQLRAELEKATTAYLQRHRKAAEFCDRATKAEAELERLECDYSNLRKTYDERAAENVQLCEAMQQACDLLAERTHGSSARSPAHHARLVLEAALSASTAQAVLRDLDRKLAEGLAARLDSLSLTTLPNTAELYRAEAKAIRSLLFAHPRGDAGTIRGGGLEANILRKTLTQQQETGGGDAGVWRPISEAPQTGTHIWACNARGEQFECWWHESRSDEQYWMDNGDSEPEPVHWMPLPAPPTPKEMPDAT